MLRGVPGIVAIPLASDSGSCSCVCSCATAGSSISRLCWGVITSSSSLEEGDEVSLMGEMLITSKDGRGARILSEERRLDAFTAFFGPAGTGRIVLAVEEHDGSRPREVAAAGD
jgi:hypothetical protein